MHGNYDQHGHGPLDVALASIGSSETRVDYRMSQPQRHQTFFKLGNGLDLSERLALQEGEMLLPPVTI